MTGTSDVAAWTPAVPGVREVFHARFTEHAYPPHTHDAWAVLILDHGAIRYDLDQRHHGAAGTSVTVLPPYVPHDGRAAVSTGFCKRVLYLEPDVLGDDVIAKAVDGPTFADPELRHRMDQLHRAVAEPGDELAAESRLAFVRERIRQRFAAEPDGQPGGSAPGKLADEMRSVLDSHVVDGITLERAAGLLSAHPTHLVRAFTRRFGLPPHMYLTGRRIDLARRLLLAGVAPADVAVRAGFYDQAHLTRHFTRYLGVPPGRYAAAPR